MPPTLALLESAHCDCSRRVSQLTTRGREPGPYANATHLESKPSSAKTATSGCWVLRSKHCPLISNDPPGCVSGLTQGWGWWTVAARPHRVSCEH